MPERSQDDVMVTAGRIIRGEQARAAKPLAERTTVLQARFVRAELLEAQDAAARRIADAEAKATAIIEHATERARDVEREGYQRGLETGLAEAAAHAVWLIHAEANADERSLERTLTTAKVLAQRLLGRSLRLDETTLLDMTNTLLQEARGARKVRLSTHPDDVARLHEELRTEAFSVDVQIVADASLQRGDFHLETDLGSLDGSLGSRIELLAEKLREGLR